MTENETTAGKRTRKELLNELVRQSERFIENRENYTRVRENTMATVLKDKKRTAASAQKQENSSSVDELVAMQQLSNSIGTAVEPNASITTLIQLTEQVIPVLEAGIFLFDSSAKNLMPLTQHGSPRLVDYAKQQP